MTGLKIQSGKVRCDLLEPYEEHCQGPGGCDITQSTWVRVLLRSVICPLKQAFCFRKSERQAYTKEDSGVSGSARKENDSAKLWAVLEIEKSALPYIRTISNYQQTTAARRAAYKFGVEIDAVLWPSQELREQLLGLANYRTKRK